MASTPQRREALERIAAYHETQLGRLVAKVADATDRYRSGRLDAFEVDAVLFQYSRAAKELWTFCNLGDKELVARIITEDPPADWWERAAPRPRR